METQQLATGINSVHKRQTYTGGQTVAISSISQTIMHSIHVLYVTAPVARTSSYEGGGPSWMVSSEGAVGKGSDISTV